MRRFTVVLEAADFTNPPMLAPRRACSPQAGSIRSWGDLFGSGQH